MTAKSIRQEVAKFAAAERELRLAKNARRAAEREQVKAERAYAEAKARLAAATK